MISQIKSKFKIITKYWFYISLILLVLSFTNYRANPNKCINKREQKLIQLISAKPININRANLQELTLLTGLGKKRAQAIIDYRRRHGKFTSLKQIKLVPGIGTSFIKANKSLIAFKD